MESLEPRPVETFLFGELNRAAFQPVWDALQVVDGDKNGGVDEFLREIYAVREKQRPTVRLAFANLIPRVFVYQYIQNGGDFEVIPDMSAEEWRKVLSDWLDDEALREQIKTHLLERDVSTQNTNRYVPLVPITQALSSAYFLTPHRYADMGCSANIALSRIATQDASFNITDNTGTWQNGIHLPMPDYVLGIDRQPADLIWLAVCGGLAEMKKMKAYLEKATALRQAQPTQTEFLQQDITVPFDTPLDGSFDLVHASAIQYMLPLDKKRQMLENAAQLLKPGGFFVETDVFDNQTIWTPRSVRTRLRKQLGGVLSQPLEIFQFSDSKNRDSFWCSVWDQGKDFEEFFSGSAQWEPETDLSD